MTEETTVEATEEDLAIRAAFDQAIENDKDEDSTKMDMIGAGAKFKNVTRLFNEFMVDSGLVKTKEEKADILSKVLGGVDLTDAEAFDECVSSIMEELEVSERSAASSLRQWAKKAEVEFYKKPKGTGVARSGITSKIFEFITANPTATEDELKVFVTEIGTENTLKHMSLYNGILGVANAIASK